MIIFINKKYNLYRTNVLGGSMSSNLFNRNILCIDLKSFFASVECINRGLDLFKTPLVVADQSRGQGAITLAVTPYLKKQGVKSRGRIFEIPKEIKYITVKPRMSLYIKKSTEVVETYLEFIDKNDLHIYSIDEAFLDVTSYLKMYQKTDYELAKMILKRIKDKTGLTATCGIGPNMLMAKIAMDNEAKKNNDGIAKWTYDDIEDKLWKIEPLSKMWGIGSKMERKLNNFGIKSVGDLANYDKNKLKKKFGVIGEELWKHANGIDYSDIRQKNIVIRDKSIGTSQILFKNYYGNNIGIIISETVDTLLIRLRKEKKLTQLVSLSIGYSKDIGGGFNHSLKLDSRTNNKKKIFDICMYMFDKYYEEDTPIRKVGISFGKLSDDNWIQLSIFDKIDDLNRINKIDEIVDDLKNKYGKNTILNASSLLNDSTIISRNNKIGGHNA